MKRYMKPIETTPVASANGVRRHSEIIQAATRLEVQAAKRRQEELAQGITDELKAASARTNKSVLSEEAHQRYLHVIDCRKRGVLVGSKGVRNKKLVANYVEDEVDEFGDGEWD